MVSVFHVFLRVKNSILLCRVVYRLFIFHLLNTFFFFQIVATKNKAAMKFHVQVIHIWFPFPLLIAQEYNG